MHRFRKLLFLLPLALAFGLTGQNAPTIAPVPEDVRAGEGVCFTSIGPPFELLLEAPAGVATMASIGEVRGVLRSRASLNDIQVTYTAIDAGGNQVDAIVPVFIDAVGPGEEAAFTVPFPQTGQSRRSVTVHVSTSTGDNAMVWERTESFFAVERNGRLYTGMASFLQLDIQAIEAEFNAGMLTEEAARAETRALLTLPHSKTRPGFQAAPIPSAVNVDQGFIDALALVPKDVPAPSSGPGVSGTCITISGHIEWQDENGNWHPAFGLNVQIWDEDTVFDEFVDVVSTDVNGNYYIEVDGDDGFLQGDRDVYVKVITANSAVSIEPAGIFTSPYEANSGVYDETPCGTEITENFFFDNNDPNPAVNLCESATWVAVYTAERLNGGSFLGQIVLEWPGDAGSANYDGSDINMRPGDRWDWDVVHHEYGHYIQDVFNTEDNPGGPHNIGDCIADVHGDDKSEGIRLAWGEAWPTYNGTVAQTFYNLASLGVPRVGDIDYADTGESNFNYSLEASSNIGVGEDNEVAIQRILWDFYDSAADGLDNVSMSDQTMFNRINAADPVSFSAAWAAIRGPMTDAELLGFGAVNTEHFVGPDLNTPADGAIVSPSSNNNFNWDRNVGCPSSYTGNSFTLRFFRADNSAPILSIPVGNVTSYALTLGELQALVGATHNVRWAVEGSHTGSPATGPYLGRSFAAVINQPPVADAGENVTAECTSATTTPVQLDGTGSSDPDGDALTYTWSAPGVTWNNANSATPTGQFPFGNTVVTLTVSDGIEEDTDQVTVTIEDTTPPVIVCPSAVTVECSGHCEGGGTLATDAQLDLFFASVSATDICDTDPVITDNAPECFPLGVTTVTFYAQDSSGNIDSCSTTVTVEDTTPPVIDVVLSRDALWPPNHKMVTITTEVTVTDVCDPNPTFVLTSITSNEPDNGLGDGDTEDDIQGDDLGDADIEFQLRSERAGVGDGRKYTIIYTASDLSGNTSTDTTCVIVPHDRRGHAMAAGGFIASGEAFVGTTGFYRIALLSTPNFDPRLVDGKRVYVGNSVGSIRPVDFQYRDINGDRVSDLVLDYSVRGTLEIRSGSTKKEPIGIHYWGADGQGYLVPDVFKLGAPIDVAVNDSDTGNDPLISDEGGIDLPGEEDNGDELLLDEFGIVVLPDASPVTVEVFTVTGRKIRTVASREMSAGRHELAWDGRNDAGERVSGGMYFYRVKTNAGMVVRKIVLTR